MGLLSISIEGPSSAQEGERIELDFRVVNPHPVTYPILLYGWIDDINNSVGLPGDVIQFPANTERVYARARTMPGHSITVYVELFIEDPLLPGGWLLDASDSLSISLTVPPPPPPPPPPEEYYVDVTVTPIGSGSVTKSPDLSLYPSGTLVTLTAHPSSGYVFDRWLYDSSSATSNPLSLRVYRDLAVYAFFALEAPPPPPPPPPSSDIKDWDLVAEGGTYELGDNIPFTAQYSYKGKAQGGSLTISLGTGIWPEFHTKHTYAPVPVDFDLAMDWVTGYITGLFTLPDTLEPGQTYSVRARLETDDGTHETDTDWGVFTISEAPPPPEEFAGSLSRKELEYDSTRGAIPVQ